MLPVMLVVLAFSFLGDGLRDADRPARVEGSGALYAFTNQRLDSFAPSRSAAASFATLPPAIATGIASVAA